MVSIYFDDRLYFFVPWIKYYLNIIQIKSEVQLHKQAVNKDLDRIVHQEKLDKARLRTSQNGKFLERLVEQDIERDNAEIGLIIADQEKTKADNALVLLEIEKTSFEKEAARLLSQEVNDKAEIQRITLKDMQYQDGIRAIEHDDIKKQKEKRDVLFATEVAELKSRQFAYSFPPAYSFLLMLSEGFETRNKYVPISFLAEIIAVLFRYTDFEKLISSDDFGSENFSKIKYVIFNEKSLSLRFSELLKKYENTTAVTLNPNIMFEVVNSLFSDSKYSFVSLRELGSLALDYAENNKLDIFESSDLGILLVGSNSDFGEVVVKELINYKEEDDELRFQVSATVYVEIHEDDDAVDRSVDFEFTVAAPYFINKAALGEFKLSVSVDTEKI